MLWADQAEEALARTSLRNFIEFAWPVLEPGTDFVPGWHIDAICEHLEAVYRREIRTLIVNIPPGHMKSLIVSVMFPAWIWANDPTERFLAGSYALELAKRDHGKFRTLVNSPWYQSKWGKTVMFQQEQAKRLVNTALGHRVAVSTVSGTTGEGGTVTIVDDPHSAFTINSDPIRNKPIQWWDDTLSTRGRPPDKAVRVVVMQRLHEMDLTGHVLGKGDPDLVHLKLPAEFEPAKRCVTRWYRDPRKEQGELLWPEMYGPEEIERLTRTMSAYAYSGQLQQEPTPAGGGILKREWWKTWSDEAGRERDPPKCEMVVQSWDTAFTERDLNKEIKGAAAYSARTTWGLFKRKEEDEHYNAILLEHWRGQVGYPDLRKEAVRAYDKWKPDWVLIEKKASGISLIQDLSRAGIPTVDFTPQRGEDKVTRAHVGSVYLRNGLIWVPVRKWAQKVIDLCAAFPGGEENDTVDTCTQLFVMLGRGGLVHVPGDPKEEEPEDEPIEEAIYG